MEKPILEDLKYAELQGEQKKQRCLQAFHKQGTVCWETVISVLTEYPFYNGKLAKRIANKYNVEWTFDEPPGEEHHKKCKFSYPVCLSVSLSVCWPVYLPICLSIYLPTHQFILLYDRVSPHKAPDPLKHSLSFTLASSTKNTPEDQPMSQGTVT